MLLKYKLDFTFKNFGQNFNSKDEKMIHYNNLFFEIDNKSVVKYVDF